MASMALCPRCSLESVIPSDTDPNSWAQCPRCSALFQVKDAFARDLAELQVIGPPDEPTATTAPEAVIPQHDDPAASELDKTIRFSSEQTIGDVASFVDDRQPARADIPADDEPDPEQMPLRSASTIADSPALDLPAPEGVEAASDGIEKWFRSAKTVPDVSPFLPKEAADSDPAATRDNSGSVEEKEPAAETVADYFDTPADDPMDATVDFAQESSADGATDYEIDSPRRPASSASTWDDSEHMDRLLADVDGLPSDNAAAETAPVATNDAEFAAPIIQTFDDRPDVIAAPSGRRRRRSSLLRTLIGTVVFGFIGLAIGYYILLALWGPRVDFLSIAQHIPRAVLPSSFSLAPTESADTTARRMDPGAVPAGFDAPSKEGDNLLDDVAKMQPSEPSQFDDTGASPLAEATAPGPNDAPSYSADQLAIALQAAKDAQPQLMAGNLSDGPAVQRAKGNSFQLLAELAQTATFVDTASRPDYVAPLQHESDNLFRQTLSENRIRDEVARIASKWMGYTGRKNDGIFFAGSVAGQTNAGELVECRVDLGAGEPVSVLVPKSLADELDASGRPMGFVGSIVTAPAQQIAGYDGAAPQAVWVSRLIELE